MTIDEAMLFEKFVESMREKLFGDHDKDADDEWLKSIGFEFEYESRSLWKSGGEYDEWTLCKRAPDCGYTWTLEDDEGDAISVPLKTRGDVCRFCFVFGIKLHDVRDHHVRPAQHDDRGDPG